MGRAKNCWNCSSETLRTEISRATFGMNTCFVPTCKTSRVSKSTNIGVIAAFKFEYESGTLGIFARMIARSGLHGLLQLETVAVNFVEP